MAFLTTTLAVGLLGICTAAAACLTTDAAAAVYRNQQRHDDDDLVATACEKAKGHEAHRYRGLGLTALTKEFCQSTLRSDTRSAAAKDTRELVLVAMELAGAAAAGAGAKARSALRSGRGSKDRDTEYSLRYCVMDYGMVAVVVPACRAVFEEYSTGDFQFQVPFDYLDWSAPAGRWDAAGDCWQRVSYEDDGLKRALWNDAVEVANRANLARAMVEQRTIRNRNDMFIVFIRL